MRSRRRAARTTAMAALISLFVSELFLATAPRSVWMHQRSCRWWEDVVTKLSGSRLDSELSSE